MSIHTLEARDNAMIEAARGYWNLDNDQIFHWIQEMRARVELSLRDKGVEYENLRSVLEPAQDRMEAAYVFDTTKINGLYGYEIMQRFIPLLHKKSKHSVLSGDYTDIPGQKEKQYKAFREAITFCRCVQYRHSIQFSIVYINNLTKDMAKVLDKGLMHYLPYVGYADTTYASLFKFYLSAILELDFIKCGQTIIQGHSPDTPDTDDWNVSSYPFEENGYNCRSINSDLMEVLLKFKIERPVFDGFEKDTSFSLISVGAAPHPIEDFDIEVSAAKVKYLEENKQNSLQKAGLIGISEDELAMQIKSKIRNNYIYGLSYNCEHNVTKFSVILEFNGSKKRDRFRLKATLEYKPEKKILRLITLY